MERSIRRNDGLDPLDGSAVRTGDLALFAEDLRTAFPETPLPERMAEDHIASMIGAIQLLAEKGESALEPTSNAHGPDRRVSGLPKLRRRTMRQKMILRLTVTAGMLVSLAGLANAGVLPDPIQGTAEDILGIDEGDQTNLDDGPVDDVDDGAVADADQGAQGNVDDDAQENADNGATGNVDDDAQEDADNGNGAGGADDANENDDAQEDADENDEAEVDEDADEDDHADENGGENDDAQEDADDSQGEDGEGSDE